MVKKADTRYCISYTFMVSLISALVNSMGGSNMRTGIIRYPMKMTIAVFICLALITLPLASMVGADSTKIVNGGFESGDLSGWTVGSTNGTVEALQADNFIPVVSPPEGTWFALLTSHSDNEIDGLEGLGSSERTATGTIGFGNGGTDLDGNGVDDYDVASLQQIFVLSAGEVPATLSFDWSFFTDESSEEYDDFFMVTLGGTDILHGSVPGAEEYFPVYLLEDEDYISPFEDVPDLDGQAYNVSSPGPTDGSTFDHGRTDFQHFSYNISSAGTYTLEFLVADQGDHAVDSGLLIDDVQLTPVESCIKFSASPMIGATPLEVQFSNESSCGCGFWNWDFGDGSSSSEENPLHTYTKPGPYTVTLSSSSNITGCECTRTKVNYIHPYTIGVGAEAYSVKPLSGIVTWAVIGFAIMAGTIILWRKRVKTNR
jgi:hypothetical protein